MPLCQFATSLIFAVSAVSVGTFKETLFFVILLEWVGNIAVSFSSRLCKFHVKYLLPTTLYFYSYILPSVSCRKTHKSWFVWTLYTRMDRMVSLLPAKVFKEAELRRQLNYPAFTIGNLRTLSFQMLMGHARAVTFYEESPTFPPLKRIFTWKVVPVNGSARITRCPHLWDCLFGTASELCGVAIPRSEEHS